jgi:YlmC/YmxH family sporulation protein
MECRVEDFRFKEVVNICDGNRLGYVCDIMFEVPQGKVTAIIIPGRCKFFGLFWREDDYIIPWECIRRIGGDIILVEVSGEYRRMRREKKPWFTWNE